MQAGPGSDSVRPPARVMAFSFVSMHALFNQVAPAMIRSTLVLLLLVLPTAVFAQGKKEPPARPEPTAADVSYGQNSERQKFDFWQAKSEQPTPLVLLIHGGGWMGGE